MVLGIRRRINEGGDLARDPRLEFANAADFLQYTKDLQDKIFHVASSLGSEQMVVHPFIQIKDIIDADDALCLINEFINPMTCDWEYRLPYFEFVDYVIECIKENKKYNCLSSIIIIRESLFNTFANGKFFEGEIKHE